MTDKEYIKGLEYLVSSLAGAYQVNFDKFYWERFKVCSTANPNRRELTELEHEIIMSFAAYQGRFRNKVKLMSELKIKQPDSMNDVIKRLLNE